VAFLSAGLEDLAELFRSAYDVVHGISFFLDITILSRKIDIIDISGNIDIS
jgi:hypothetical protein